MDRHNRMNRFQVRHHPYSRECVDKNESPRGSVGQAGCRSIETSSVERHLKSFLEATELAAGSDDSATLYQESRSLGSRGIRADLIHPIRDDLDKAAREDNLQGFNDIILKAIRKGVVLTHREYFRLNSHNFERSPAYMIPIHIFSALFSVVREGNSIFQCLKNPASYIQPSIDQLRTNGSLQVGLDSNRGLIVLIYSYTLMLDMLLKNAVSKQQCAVCPIPCDMYAKPKPAAQFARYDLNAGQAVIMHTRMQTLNQMLLALLDHNADRAEQLAKECTPGMEEFFTAMPSFPISREDAHRLLKDCFIQSPESFKMTSLMDALEQTKF